MANSNKNISEQESGSTSAEAEQSFPEWNVYFDGNFWGYSGNDEAGKEIPLGAHFLWGGRDWLIPAVYLCSKGLVIDFCIQIAPELIRVFMDKWNLNCGEALKQFSGEQLMEINRDNPLCPKFTPGVFLNGEEYRPSHGCGESYNPCLPESEINEAEVKQAIDHYGFDPTYGWSIWRSAFLWNTKQQTEIKKLSVTMEQQMVPILGPRFRASAAGDTFDFIYPPNGGKHTLTVREYERQEISEEHFGREFTQEFPTHYVAMSYTITPELQDKALTISDCADSDTPRQKFRSPLASRETDCAVAVGIIGGADGPTSITFGRAGKGELRTACSAIHFEPVKDVEWQLVFHEKQFDDLTVSLIER